MLFKFGSAEIFASLKAEYEQQIISFKAFNNNCTFLLLRQVLLSLAVILFSSNYCKIKGIVAVIKASLHFPNMHEFSTPRFI